MTMICPKCQIVFQDGQICPNCRGYLMPYQPQPQPVVPQPQYAPAPVYEAPETSTSHIAPSSKGKTVAIAVLAVLLAALTAFCVFLLLQPAPEPETVEKVIETETEQPTATEQSVADNAWEYTVRVGEVMKSLGSTDQPLADVMEKMGSGRWSEAFAQSAAAGMSQLGELVAMSDEGYKEAIDAPMQSLGSRYPALALAWNGLVKADIKYSTSSDTPTVSQEELDRYASLQEDFRQAAADAGFDTSGWLTE